MGIAPRPPKAVFFDLDNTFYGYDVCHRAALSACVRLAKRRMGLSRPGFLALYDGARRAVHVRLKGTGASHHRLLYFQALTENALGRTDPSLALEFEERYWSAYLAAMRLAPGVKEFLADLGRRGVKRVIVSDLVAGIQLRKIIRLGLRDMIDFIVTSEEAGREKPAPNVFRLALQKARCRPAEVWMVGDSAERDVRGAARLGVRAVYFHRYLPKGGKKLPAGVRADVKCGSFRELRETLRGV